MTNEQEIKAKADQAVEMFRPFSNGTSAMFWYGENCETCKKAFFPNNGEYPSDRTMKQYCSIGKECKLKYALDFAFITGEITLDIAKQIGIDKDGGLKESCMMWSDDKDDGFKYPKKPTPKHTPDNQIMLFTEFDELVNNQAILTELKSRV